MVFLMAGSVNKVILLGNVGKDPDIRVTQEGKEIATFSLATTDVWKDRNTGERREKTEWHRVVVFIPALSDLVKKYVTKGSRVYIEGSLQTREWNDQSGVKKFTTEVVLQAYESKVVLLSNRSEKKDHEGFGGGAIREDDIIDDDIPF